ncbi:hypothetical protein [Parabacteroides goldsteinii]|uniref:hypothetical protein n=1 Tax=Parabacteroides goldsteinii TaxID=328812 RepID=UPI002165467B|nr:hypothetical protein [Parabacteroides goldsteinii]MCS2425282.1 hypothetical protein [Parabacteroides goldsteinii]
MRKKKIENEPLAKELSITELLGQTFIKTPRSIFKRMQSDDIIDRQMAHLHLLLFGICYHTDGYCIVNKRAYTCRRGEFIGKQSTLAKWMDVSSSTLSRLLKRMKYLKLISIQRIIGGSRIYLTGYDEFTFVPTEPETGNRRK